MYSGVLPSKHNTYTHFL